MMRSFPLSSAVGLLLLTASAARAQEPVPPAPAAPPAEPAPAVQLQPVPAPEQPLPAPTYPPAPADPGAYLPTAPLAPAPPEAVEAPEPPPLPDKVGIGKNGGFFQPGALLQIWGLATHSDAAPGTDTTFRLRRAELKVRGELLPKLLSYTLVADFAKVPAFTATPSTVNVTAPDGTTIGTVAVPQPTLAADRSPLQDVWITILTDYADISLGQGKIPVSLEALQSSARLLFPERSRVSREFGDRRDIGIKVEKKIGDYFYYYAGFFNGQGQNVTDADRRKDAGLRLEVYPIKGLTVGAVAYGTVGGRDLNVRDRLEADLRLEIDKLVIQGEYIHGWTGAEARRLEGHGLVGAAGYTFIDRLQPALRIGLLDINLGDDIDPRTEAESGPLRFFEFGLNYLLHGPDVKFTLAVAQYSQEHGADLTEGTMQWQANF